MARQASETNSKIDNQNFFSQFSIAHQTGSNRLQPNIANNSSTMGRALPKTGSGYDSPVA